MDAVNPPNGEYEWEIFSNSSAIGLPTSLHRFPSSHPHVSLTHRGVAGPAACGSCGQVNVSNKAKAKTSTSADRKFNRISRRIAPSTALKGKASHTLAPGFAAGSPSLSVALPTRRACFADQRRRPIPRRVRSHSFFPFTN